MQLFIKNMVCQRCVLVVQQQLDKLNLPYKNIQLGEVTLSAPPTGTQLQQLREDLHTLGFELLDDKRSTVVEKIKNTIIQQVHHNNGEASPLKLSALLEQQLNMDYHYLSTLFSGVEGITIEKYAILQRIERAKELLLYNELTLGEIADQLGYSSVQHLSQQFKKVTGLTPSHFKQLKENKRKPLDQV